MSTTLTLAVTYGLGGADPDDPTANIIETVTANQADDGTWTVTTVDEAGTSSRPATDDETAGFNAQIAPVETPAPDPAMSDFVSTLTDEQKAALKLALDAA